ncbi:MAG: CHAP domain-containing protein [Ruminococcus sp.]|nr:CHAP domain-containing protein [Ruminococcus sp.]
MRKLPIVLTAAAICSIAAAVPATSYAAEDGTPERAAEIALDYYRGNSTFTDTSTDWCVLFAIHCVRKAGGELPGVRIGENSTTNCIVTIDPSCYHSWETEYWSYNPTGKEEDLRENPKYGTDAELDYTPKVGDLVFFDNSDDEDFGPGPDHTGIVVDVNGTGQSAIITTCEGNINDDVTRVQYQYREPIPRDDDGRLHVDEDTKIIGFATPIYPNASSTPSTPSNPSTGELVESPIISSPGSRQRALEQAQMRKDKSKRPAGYDKFSITFVDEVLKASGAKTFYNYPEVPRISEFVADYKKNGAYFEASSYICRVGDVAVIENNGNTEDGADQLAIISGVNYVAGKKEIYVIKYDPSTDRVCDSELCQDTILGFCVPYYEYDDLGDVTYDGRVDVSDVTKIMDFIASGKTDYSVYQKLCADVNKNGYINKMDYSDLQKKLSKQLIFEAETDQSSKVGKKESDCVTATTSDDKGYMVYGPYISGLSYGDKEVTFRMKTDNNTADNEVVARIEVNDTDLGGIIASKEIRRKDFLTPDAYQDFHLEYENGSASNRIEYRVYYFQKALISVDSVTVRDVSVKTEMKFEAESDLSSQMRTKGEDGKYGRDGIEAYATDKPGCLAYGPYVDKLALGSFRADYSLKVDNNTINADVLRIDVYNTTKNQIVAQKTIKCTDFKQANFTQVFSLYFNNTQLNDVYEFRTYYLGNSETIIDKVNVVRLDKPLASKFTADDMKMTEGCSKSDLGINLKNSGDRVYGPYTDNISLGKNRAIFNVDISESGSSDDVVAIFDVFTSDNDTILAKKELKRSELVSDGNYHVLFDLPAEYAESKIEFRVTATGSADLTFKKVVVTSQNSAVKKQSSSNSIPDSSLLNTTSRTVIMNGIDVSGYQNENTPGNIINWQKVKNSGIDFVILRIGLINGKNELQKDEYIDENYQGATSVGLKVGGYWYSRALTVEQAREEARCCLEYLGGKHLDFPLYFDLEDGAALESGMENCTAMAMAFCEEIEKAGYTPGIYVSKGKGLPKISEEKREKYALWIAVWNNDATIEYYKPMGIWQHSETGRVDGITGDVDLDRCYVDYPSIIG